jgi:hypothetical protein
VVQGLLWYRRQLAVQMLWQLNKILTRAGGLQKIAI